MHLLLLSWVLHSFAAFGYGSLLMHDILGVKSVRLTNDPFGISLLGLLFIGVVSHGWSCFFPVNSWYALSIFTFGILFGVRQIVRQRVCNEFSYGIGKNQYLFLAPIAIGIVVASLALPRLGDAGGYYIPQIALTNQYASVPGIGNLNVRYGLHSSMFSLHAVGRAIFGDYSATYSLNGLVSILLSLHVFITVRRLKAKVFSYSLGLSAIMLYGYVTSYLSTPMADVALGLYTVFLYSILLNYFDAVNESDKVGYVLLLALVASLVIPIKASALLYILFIGSAMILEKDTRVYWIAGIGAISVATHLAKNLITTGYPLYPMVYGTWIHPDWMMSIDTVVQVRDFVYKWAIAASDWTDVPSNIVDRYIMWWQHMVVPNRVVAVMSFLGVPFGLKLILNYYTDRFRSAVALTPLIVVLIAWFITAPNIRFAYGVLVVFVSLPFAFVLFKCRANWKLVAPLIIVLYAAGVLRFHGRSIVDGSKHVFSVRRIAHPAVKHMVYNGIQYVVPMEGLCWGCEQPCIPKEIDKVEWRGGSFPDGVRPMNPN
ncbi:hypothetical protein KQI65_00265 [bacterium]|nr:hypothetical protein [bacterium]